MPQLSLFYSSQVAAESEATQHLAELEKPFKCTECDLSFTTNAAKNIHSKTHLVVQKLKCSICPYMTNDHNELRKHRMNNCIGKQKIFRCHACDFMCHSKPMMKSHFFSAHTDPEKLHECPDCDFKALKINALNIHVKQQHSAPMEYACTSCDFVCNSQTVIKNHIIKRHSDENIGIGGVQEPEPEVEPDVTNINKYACASCDFMCSSMADIKVHISLNHAKDSPIKATNLIGLDEPDEPYEPRAKKSQVKRSFLNIEKPYGGRRFACTECDFKCFKKRGIEVHMSRVHKFTFKNDKFTDKDDDKHKLKQVNYLLEPIPVGIHPDPGNEKINSHDERRIFKCPLCKFKGTLFGFKIHRNNHMSRKCKICGAKCKSEKGFEKHMKSHDGYSCELCDFTCETDLGFQSHMDLSHNTAAMRFSCPKCKYKCNTQMDLRRHVSVHEPQKQFVCPECEDSYDEKSELMHHMLCMNHTGGKPFSCTKCKAQFLTEAGLKIHLDSHEPEPNMGEFYSDSENEDEFEEEYDDDIESSSERRRKSSSPRKVVDDSYLDDEDYEDENSNDEFDSCDLCDFEGTELEVKTHMSRKHKTLQKADAKTGRRTKRLRCFYSVCPFRSNSFTGLQLHARTHIKALESVDAPKKLLPETPIEALESEDASDQKSPKKQRPDKLRCAHPSCDYTAITIKGIQLHAKMIHQNFKLEEIPSPKKLNSNFTTPNMESNSDEKMEKCPDCDYFGTIRGLNIHYRTHSVIKPYKCRVCDFKCLTENALETHVTCKHGTDEFACKECDFKGISMVGFARHYSRAHNILISYDKENSLDYYACDACDYKGASTQGLRVHKSRMHSVKLTQNDPKNDVAVGTGNVPVSIGKNSEKHPINIEKEIPLGIVENESEDIEKFACSQCDFKGTTTQLIRKHILRVHSVKVPQNESENHVSVETSEIDVSKSETEDKSFACDDCDYVGTYRGLRSHIKVHSKDPFSCKECDFKCLKQKVLDTHIKSKHVKKKCNECDYVGSAKGLKCHSKAHTTEKPFSCLECEFKCLTQKVLDTHIHRSHGDDKFSCSMCSYKGNSAQGLKCHSVKLHSVKVPSNDPKSDNSIDCQEVNVSNIESCSNQEEELSPDNKTCLDEAILSDNETGLENDEISPEKESNIENGEITPVKKSCLKKKEAENKEVSSEKMKGSILDSQDTPKEALSEKRVRQVNQKCTIKDYFVTPQGSTPKREHTERESKRLKKDPKVNDKVDEQKPDRNNPRKCVVNDTEAPLKHNHKGGSPCKACSAKRANNHSENKEQADSESPEKEDSQGRPKRIKLVRNNTPGRERRGNNNKVVPRKDVEQKDSSSDSTNVIKPAENKKRLATKMEKEQKENKDNSEGQELVSRNSTAHLTDNKVLEKDVHHKDSPIKEGFVQNVNKKKKFEEYMKMQANKPNGAEFDRTNIKREKGFTCLCLECGARFTAKTALEKHMSIHL